jgi:lipooligosaccharide transport system permease protein
MMPGSNVSHRAWRVWQRDFDVYRTTWKLNFLPPLMEPVLYVLAFGLGMGKLIGSVSYFGDEIPYLTFMVPGILAVAIMFWSYFETTYSSFVRMYYQRTFEAMVATPLLVDDVIAGEWLWGATKSLLAASLMLLAVSVFGLASWPSSLLVLPLAIAGGLLFSALGLITTALSPTIESFNLPIFLLIFPMFLFSGTFFPIDILPLWAKGVALALPLTHISLLVRGAFLGAPPPMAWASVLYLAVVTPIVVAIAFRLMKRRLVK